MREIPSLQRGHQINAAISFIKSIRKCYPDCVLVQNNGLNLLSIETANWIDGICWENPQFNNIDDEWSENMINRLAVMSHESNIKIMLLLETIYQGNLNLENAKQKAEKYHFLIYEAPAQYVSGVNVCIEINSF